MKDLLLALSLLCCSSLWAQTGSSVVAYYNFDSGDASESQGNENEDGIMQGNPQIGCGPSGGSLLFDGVADYVIFPGIDLNMLFERSDFVVSFYFHPTGINPRQTIISKQEECEVLNSRFAVEYLPAQGALEIAFQQNSTQSLGGPSQLIPLDPTRCWHHFVLERRNSELRIYLNGERVLRLDSGTRLNIGNNAILTLARAACPSRSSNFRGFIDELTVLRGSQTLEVIDGLFIPVDRIADLAFPVINEGTSVQFDIPNTCANNFRWTPEAEIDSGVNTPSPTVSPAVSTRYFVEMSYANSGCRSQDSVLVQVFNPDDFDCTQLLVPSGFTPNGLGPQSNERLGISNAATLQTFDVFEIFDRWGNLVFRTEDPFGTWDGSYNGQNAMPGVYLWHVSYGCNGEDLDRTGSVTLIR